MRRIKRLWRLWKCERTVFKLDRVFVYLADRGQYEAAKLVLDATRKTLDEIHDVM
jgi:hypothetical protein